ncbi:pyridoxamine 5'-phosphate oxidase [Fulvivirga sp. RKSG066]|uniref:pyridoxamine 5'-phosphate oxidase n=1 Tax=Fulvivirga aurantia TaxID=2529383 RepID=UPI0012BBA05F|nr:pyridoxamine 5'-phosphate oxidase [Fulvivirga aurantia]MTI20662.1 pyridoxamine 5'-phosphate oxidase [Fulvivirga aurantia]
MSQSIADIRSEYKKNQLNEEAVSDDPIQQFESWFKEAVASEVIEPNAMNLSTVSPQGMPSARIVLLKGIEKDGFVFYTNYQSNKGKELEDNPLAALTFFWPELERQVRIQGQVEKVSKEVSESYFQSRPKSSQIGAWASPQSSVIGSREILEEREKQLSEKFKDQEKLPKPEQWGGYILKPVNIEFWQGRASRLHDRILYTQNEKGWVKNRLAP